MDLDRNAPPCARLGFFSNDPASDDATVGACHHHCRLVGWPNLGLTIIVGIVLVEVGVKFIRIGRVGTPRTRRGDPIYFSPSRPSVARVRPPSTSKQSIQQRSNPTRVPGGSRAPPHLDFEHSPQNSDNNTATFCAPARCSKSKRNDPRRRVFDTSPSNEVKTPQNAASAPRARPGTRTGRRSSRPCEEKSCRPNDRVGAMTVDCIKDVVSEFERTRAAVQRRHTSRPDRVMTQNIRRTRPPASLGVRSAPKYWTGPSKSSVAYWLLILETMAWSWLSKVLKTPLMFFVLRHPTLVVP